MIEAKKDGISLFIERTPLVGDAAVGISFKAKINSCCLNKLKGACNCSCYPSGSEEACLCYTIFLVVQDLLCGSPLATMRSKVGAVDCGVHDGHFTICWKVKGTGSAVRKSIGIALKGLAPGKLYAGYTQCVKAAQGKPKREEFNYVAEDMTKAIKNGVMCGVVGNVKTTKEVVEAMVDVLAKKLNPGTVKGAKKEPKDHTPCDHSEKTEIKTSGWQAAVVRDYVASKIKGVTPVVCDKYVMLNLKPSLWDTASAKMKKYVKDYVAQKYARVGDELANLMGYHMLSNAYVCADEVRSMLKSGVKASDVEKALNSAL